MRFSEIFSMVLSEDDDAIIDSANKAIDTAKRQKKQAAASKANKSAADKQRQLSDFMKQAYGGVM